MSWTQRITRFLTRRKRPWNTDDRLALFAWTGFALVSASFLATTTIASIVLYLFERFDSSESIRRRLEGHFSGLLESTTVRLDGALQPNWRDRTITLKGMSVERASNSETLFHVIVAEVTFKLSLFRFLEGKGLVDTCQVKGVRGHVKRVGFSDRPVQLVDYHPGDFELRDVRLEDLSLFIEYPSPFRSYELAIFSAELPVLRKQWLLYDFVHANSISGMYDRSLFSSYVPSIQIKTAASTDLVKFSRLRHFKVDGVKFDHIYASSSGGPLSWIQKGSVDIDALLVFPESTKPSRLGLWLSRTKPVDEEAYLDLYHPGLVDKLRSVDTSSAVSIFMGLRMKNLKALMPLYDDELSLMNNTLARPIVAYINNHRPALSLQVFFPMNKALFNGAWTLYDSSFNAMASNELYLAMLRMAETEMKNTENIRKFTKWGLFSIGKNVGSVFESIVSDFHS